MSDDQFHGFVLTKVEIVSALKNRSVNRPNIHFKKRILIMTGSEGF